MIARTVVVAFVDDALIVVRLLIVEEEVIRIPLVVVGAKYPFP